MAWGFPAHGLLGNPRLVRPATVYMAVYGTQGCRQCCRTCAYVAMHDACRICDGVRGRSRRISYRHGTQGCLWRMSYERVRGRLWLTRLPMAHVVPARTWPVHGEYRAATAYVAVYGTQGCRRRMSYELVPYAATHDACRICDGVRAAHGKYRTATAYVAVYGSQGCRRRCRTCAYVAVHGKPRTCVGVRDHVRRRSYL